MIVRGDRYIALGHSPRARRHPGQSLTDIRECLYVTNCTFTLDGGVTISLTGFFR